MRREGPRGGARGSSHWRPANITAGRRPAGGAPFWAAAPAAGVGGCGIKGLLVEGGGETATRFVRKGLADKLTLFYAPKLLGSEGVPMIGALRATKVAESLQFSVSEVGKVGDDVAVTLYPGREEERVHRAC